MSLRIREPKAVSADIIANWPSKLPRKEGLLSQAAYSLIVPNGLPFNEEAALRPWLFLPSIR